MKITAPYEYSAPSIIAMFIFVRLYLSEKFIILNWFEDPIKRKLQSQERIPQSQQEELNIQKKYETPAKAIQVEYKKNVKYIKIVNRFAFIWGKFFLFYRYRITWMIIG